MRQTVTAATLIALLPLGAQAFTAKNRLTVAPVTSAVFEVVGQPGSGAAQFWCAAGEYALNQGARSNARIYVESGRQGSVTEPGKTAVRFTLSPDAAGVTPISPQLTLSTEAVGDNLSVASAREYCQPSISRF